MSFKKMIHSGIAAMAAAFCFATINAKASINIFIQPTNQVISVGSNAVFSAQATAGAGETITGYSWVTSTNGQNPFITIPNATSASLTISNAQATNSGFYFVRVTYNSGTNVGLISVSSSVTLTVQDQINITAQPQSLTRNAGASASFSVTASHSLPITYQWRRNGTNLANGGRISGATGATITIISLAATDAGNFDVVLSNTSGSITSQVATLNVLLPPTITMQPQNTTTILSNNATFSVAVTGSAPLAFQWKKGGVNLSNVGRISGATSNTLTITGALTNDTGNYSVSISNAVKTVTSSNATLTVFAPPIITSATNATGRQGTNFNYTITTTGTAPVTFGASGLPAGLSLTSSNGLISGVPLVSGVFDVTLFATNAAMTTTGLVTITLTTGVPGITSSLFVNNAKQGQFFSYAIIASNDPVSFSVSALPLGLSLNPATGVISGPPVVNGSYLLIIGASNPSGSDSKALTLNIASALPTITSPLTKTGTENQAGFSYTITANNSPTQFRSSPLPLGLTLNATNGIISGTPLYGGTFPVTIWADNAWGAGSANLTINLNYANLNRLVIANVVPTYSSPYLLDFSFSLRDVTSPTSSVPVVRHPSQLQVICSEGDNTNGMFPISDETAFIVDRGNKKQLKTFFALDYSYSMFSSPGAIEDMQSAAKTLINAEPATAQFGIYEFHADDVAPQLVTNFISDKAVLNQAIDGIQTNYVKGYYAGSRAFDAIAAAINQFGPANRDEERFVIAMTDGNDESSLVNTNADPISYLITLALSKQVRVYCVAYGANINENALTNLTSKTFGRYYEATTTANLAEQFLNIVKDIDGQYLVRWATLKRANKAFQPSFRITLNGLTDSFNANFIYITNDVVVTNTVVDTNTVPFTTNTTVMTNSVTTTNLSLPYNPTNYAGDTHVGALRLVPDTDLGPQVIRLRTTYTPRYVRQIRVNYQANFPCTVSLNSTNTGEILNGWSLAQTNDGLGGEWLTLTSADTTNLTTSIPYAALGDLLTFRFRYTNQLAGQKAFGRFTVDNTIYTNMVPGGQSFVLVNTNVVTVYPATPPLGTPVPWLQFYGFSNNLAAAELSDPNGNGLAVWQEYLAGLNPRDTNATLAVRATGVMGTNITREITFGTVQGRTYRVESTFLLGSGWTVLRDNIAGTGGNVIITDLRDLSGVTGVYYRIAVY